MSFLSNLSALISRQLLVVEADETGISATVARARGQRVDTGPLVRIESHASGTSLLEQLVAEVRKVAGRCPRFVILLSSDVISAVVELPAGTQNDCSRRELEEMIRWELEPNGSTYDHGEFAATDELCCGFTRMSSQSLSAGLTRWLACGIPRTQMRHWDQAFADQKIRLRGVYPVSSPAREQFGFSDESDETVILERMRYAAFHALMPQQNVDGVCVSSKQHRESRWSGKHFRQLIVAAALLFICGLEVSLEFRHRDAATESVRIAAARVSGVKEREQEAEERKRAEELEDTLADEEIRLDKLEARRRDLQHVASARIGSLNWLLDVVVRGMTDELILRSVTVDMDGTANIVFWSLAEDSGQRFVNQLAINAYLPQPPSVKLTSTDELFGLQGYQFDIELLDVYENSQSDSPSESFRPPEKSQWTTTKVQTGDS